MCSRRRWHLTTFREAADRLAAELMGGLGGRTAGDEARMNADKAQAEEARRKDEAEAARKAAGAEKERLEAERKAAEALLPVNPRVARGRIGVGLNYPGLGLRALIGTRWLLEAGGQ